MSGLASNNLNDPAYDAYTEKRNLILSLLSSWLTLQNNSSHHFQEFSLFTSRYQF